MARGIVKQLSGAEIMLTLDKRLRRAFGPEAQHSAASSSREGKSSTTAEGSECGITSQRDSWRLDKDDVASVFVRLRRNLMGGIYRPRHALLKTDQKFLCRAHSRD